MERLVVDGWGRFLGVEDGQIVVKERKGKSYSVICRSLPSDLRQVVIAGKGSLSSDAIDVLAHHGVDLIFLDWRGGVSARLSPPMLRTVNTRREQYRCYDTEKGAALAKAFIRAKMKNQMAVLGTYAKTRVQADPNTAEALRVARESIERIASELESVSGTACDAVRGTIMGMEGCATGVYWNAISKIVDESFGFNHRSGRYAGDPVNALLNYGYAILEGECWRAVHYAGLDPYGGFLHVDRPGRASMVYDLIEEFRQQVVDKSTLKLLSHRQIRTENFEVVDGVCRMDDATRRLVLSELLMKMDDRVRYKDKLWRWSDLILHQAREVAKFLRGESGKYEGFWLRW
ncbi:MAG: CRISPR-associated endonuclease Cas1 [Methanomicrobiales archaeon]|nr:CRISPR-associated endonuclease Cas1 [Methanomicrobiales archaeon]MDI6876083.1 CRISPR-associated endonuclease Cas1 [Methanomicrobiales archaeon]